MKLMPASRAAWMMRIDSSWSGSPQAPNIIAPRQSLLTETPVRPSGRCSMDAPWSGRRRHAGMVRSGTAGRSGAVLLVGHVLAPAHRAAGLVVALHREVDHEAP